jgi:hypothetical protein
LSIFYSGYSIQWLQRVRRLLCDKNDLFSLIQKTLVRDPAKRASLDYIVKSSWVRAGDKGHSEVLPLISRTNLPDTAHETIVEQMVAGGIGTEDNILK